MIWEKEDRLRPTQPYSVLDTTDFRQEVYLRDGISHFYGYYAEKDYVFRVVPDGCADLFFEYHDGEMRAFACGTVLEYTMQNDFRRGDVFGVRFMPGFEPAGMDVCLKDLIGKRVPLEEICECTALIEKLGEETEFYQRIRIFIQEYTKLEKRRKKPIGKKKLVQAIKVLVYESDGKIEVQEISDQTGYSVRYINRIFTEEMGFSPKTFCKIIQFQRALEFLNYGGPDNMADAAVALGFYDQSQFIRDFRKFAGITPKQYLKTVVKAKYKERIDTGIGTADEKTSADLYNFLNNYYNIIPRRY